MGEGAYTIKEAAERSGLSPDTIRYYEKIGLLPRAERSAGGHRVYDDEAVDSMKLIRCLKKTDMPLEEMKPYLRLSLLDDIADYPDLQANILRYRQRVLDQIASLERIVDFIDRRMQSPGAGLDNCGETGAETPSPRIRSVKRKKLERTAIQATYAEEIR